MLLAIAILMSIFVVLALLYGRLKKTESRDDARGEGDEGGPLPYRRREYVMTKAEHVFFDVLEGLLQHPTDPNGPRQMRVFPQVVLSRVVQVEAGVEGWQKWHNKIDRACGLCACRSCLEQDAACDRAR
jgi:hypothetical protein